GGRDAGWPRGGVGGGDEPVGASVTRVGGITAGGGGAACDEATAPLGAPHVAQKRSVGAQG
ncbi:MAG TPA: hypothetical protein VKT18_09405, partial [Acidimicrobiales bacterium]|nr:hypothetical protein [Acidimicrobiales bacterium]